jgi:hypothetical protein
MILLKLKGEKVIHIDRAIPIDYVANEGEVLVEALPPVSISGNQRAYIYYRNGNIEYDIKEN